MSKCPDCRVEPNHKHHAGCDVERCSHCQGQWISCGCKEHDPSKSMWTGEWPGVVECRERGWYTVLEKGTWRPCAQDVPGAVEDLNRWTRFVMREMSNKVREGREGGRANGTQH